MISELIIRSEELIQHEPLSQEQVEMLSSHLNKYVLPQNQTKSGLHALILYTTDYREGAIAEAKDLEDSFKVRFCYWPVFKTSVDNIPTLMIEYAF